MKKFLKLKTKLKIKKFFKEDLWQYTLVIAFIFIISWILSKPYEAIMFTISHVVLRPLYEKEYHKEITRACLFVTCGVITIGLLNCLPTSISLLSSLPIASFICWFGYIMQDRIDLKHKLSPNLKSMPLDEFINFCKLKNLTIDEIEIANKIIREELKGECLYRTIGYSKPQTARIRKRIFTKLNYDTKMIP